jgi:hypothetical protein
MIPVRGESRAHFRVSVRHLVAEGETDRPRLRGLGGVFAIGALAVG